MDPCDPELPGAWPSSSPFPRRREPHSDPYHDAHSTSSSADTGPTPTTSPKPSDPKRKKPRTWKPRTCRICLETVDPTFHPGSAAEPGGGSGIFGTGPRVSYDSDGGRLISPCKCKGSAKYVHEKCLQLWRHADSSGMRNFYKCPTCLFSYRLARLAWGQVISSVAAQLILTFLIFFATIFVLGFVAEPLIAVCMDPWGSIFSLFSIFSWSPVWADEADYRTYDAEDSDRSWATHFTMGFASLGMLSVAKTMLTSPVQIWIRRSGRRGQSGRDRLSNLSWLMILIGAATFVFGVWKLVRVWSKKTLEKASGRVLDVAGNGEDDDDEDDDSE